MKIIILSTDKSILKWMSLFSKIARLKKVLKVWDISVKTIDSIPPIVNGRVAKYWLNYLVQANFNLGYDIVALHMSDKQRKAWGVKPSLLGSNPNTKQEYGDFYFWSDENTKNKKHGGDDQFYQTFLHELSHEYFQQTGLKDITHTYHEEHKDITGLIKSFDWTLYQPKRMALKKEVSYLQRLVFDLLTKFKGMQKKGIQPLVQRQADKIVAEMAKLGHPVRVVQGYRSIEEQNRLYSQGRTTAGAVVTKAKGGESFHNYGVAVDFVFKKEGYNVSEVLWQKLGNIGKAQGFEWGGDWTGFVDRPHFEMKLGYSLSDFQKGKVDFNKFK